MWSRPFEVFQLKEEGESCTSGTSAGQFRTVSYAKESVWRDEEGLGGKPIIYCSG